MAIQFIPLPPEVFPKEAQPHIQRFNRQLRDLFGLEGTINEPRSTKRSDNTIARRESTQVDVSRITPDIMNVVSGVSSVLGIPNLTFSTTNAIGTTSSVLSVNSTIKLFDTTVPANSDAGAAVVGSVAFPPHRDHKHLVSTAAPGFTLGTADALGSSVTLVRSDASIAMFGTQAPLISAATAVVGTSAFSARGDHAHEHSTTLQSTANSFTLLLEDDGTDATLTLSSGVLIVPGDFQVNLNLGVGVSVDSAFEVKTSSGLLTDGTTNHGALNFTTLLSVVSGAFAATFDGALGQVSNSGSSVNATGKWSGFRGGVNTASSASLADTACFRSLTSFVEISTSPTLTSHVNFLSEPPAVTVILAGVSTLTTGYGFRHVGWAAADLTVGIGWAFYADADPSLFTAIGMAIVAKTGDYVLTDADYTVTFDTSGGAATATLPALSGRLGRIYNVKNDGSSTNVITVDGDGSDIDGSPTATFSTLYMNLQLQAGASEWHIL